MVMRCPFCQVPFKAFPGQPVDLHTMECMDIPVRATKECPVGLSCENLVPGHYRRFTHHLMACHLAGKSLPGSTECPFGLSCESLVPGHYRHFTHHMMACHLAGKSLPGSTDVGEDFSTKDVDLSSLSPGPDFFDPVVHDVHTHTGDGFGDIMPILPEDGLSYSGHRVMGKRRTSDGNDGGSTDGESLCSVKRGNCSSNASLVHESSVRNSSQNVNQMEGTMGQMLSVLPCNCENNTLPSIPDIPTPKMFRSGKSVLHNHSTHHMHNPDSDGECDILLAALTDDVNGEDLNRAGMLSSGCVGGEPEGDESNLGRDFGLLPSECSTLAEAASHCDPVSPVQPKAIKQSSLLSFFHVECKKSAYDRPSQALLQDPVARSGKLTLPGIELAALGKSFKSSPNAFLKKMSSGFERSQRLHSVGKDAAVECCRTVRYKRGGQANCHSFGSHPPRSCPFYKKIPGTGITVDAFCYGEIDGCTAYVLTHFHYDHYRGLNKRFSRPIYCSQVTANLLECRLRVPARIVNRVPLQVPTLVDGVWMTFMDANHCPGAVIVLFELPNHTKILHTGDFRAHPAIEEYPPLLDVSISSLYLDTTYCDSTYNFPSQQEVIEFVVSTAMKAVSHDPLTLVVCGAYTIGKERVFIALAEALHTKICVQPSKRCVLSCLRDPSLLEMVTVKLDMGGVHVLPMMQIKPETLRRHLLRSSPYTSVLAFEPTGWTQGRNSCPLSKLRPRYSGNEVTIYGVPYSEHSSFTELERFVRFVRPAKIIPTVNGESAKSRAVMEAIFHQWLKC